MGCTENHHNYHVYFPYLRMKVVQRDVNFDEEKLMWCSLEREIQIPPEDEILAPKEEPQEVVEEPKIEEKRMAIATQQETSREGRKITREVEILV